MTRSLLRVWLILLLLPQPAPSRAGEADFPARAGVDYTFGQRFRFTLEAESPVPLVEAALFYRFPGMEAPQTARIALDGQTRIQVTYERDLRQDPLPPFAPLTFWWGLQDAEGHWRFTEPQTIRYQDNRVAWQTLEEGPLRLHWHAGDPGLARSALELARQSLERIGGPLGYTPAEPIELFWYGAPELARAAFRLAGLDLEGEVRPLWRAVILRASPDAAGLETLRRVIPHELTHVILQDLAGGRPLPGWLEEGWALLNEGTPDPDLVRALQEPRWEGITLSGLCGDFPSDPLRARQAYGLAWAVVRYIRDREGMGGLRRLLQAYAEERSCESGVRQVLGRSLARLEAEAVAALQPRPLLPAALEALGPWLALFLLMSLGPLSLLLPLSADRSTPPRRQ